MGITAVCKYCSGTGKLNIYDPITGKWVNNLLCPCQSKQETMESPELKDLVNFKFISI
jgi:hypothetical protein